MPDLNAPADAPAFVHDYVNLASAGLGARALSCTDDFFAAVERMLADHAPVDRPGVFDDHGAWKDGWESRRRRGPGHDTAVVALAAAGRIFGFDVDTAYFTGNYPTACSIEACRIAGEPDDATTWIEILPQQPLGPGQHHYFACASDAVWSHLRLHIYPDGGVARLRVHGRPMPDAAALAGQELDLAGALNGGRVIGFSRADYGDYQRMLAPGRGLNMGDGWETRRRREPGHEWMVIRLGARGAVSRIVVDTGHLKGNFPAACSVEAADLSAFGDAPAARIVNDAMFWPVLLAEQPLTADSEHAFGAALIGLMQPVTHVKLSIYPDGGINRFRVYGTI